MHPLLKSRIIYMLQLIQLLKNPEQVDSSAENNNLLVNNNTAGTANHSIEQWRYTFKLLSIVAICLQMFQFVKQCQSSASSHIVHQV